jgi:tRNA threonylcarbamoyladenosine biosynthesis protein TsaB
MNPARTPDGSTDGGLFLAMDTSGKEGSVALGGEGPGGELEVLARTELRAEEEHASLLVPKIRNVLEEAGAGISDLAGIVVGAGPGSFTGVRIGAATAKGMAWALQLRLWAFSSLAGAAADVVDDPFRPRLVLFDARGDRVYAAAYRPAHSSLETLLSPRATTVGEVIEAFVPPGALLMGDGALRHRDLLEGAGNRILPHPAGRPSAGGLLRLLSVSKDARPVENVGRWEPDYLRESGAERMWKTRGGGKGR